MQIFRPGANTVATLLLASLGVIPVLAVGLAYQIAGSPYITKQNVTVDQPVPFSHEHHVGGLGLDCRYCHSSVEKARFAGLPPTETCMTCHSQIWTNAEMLAPVRASLAEDRPIRLAARQPTSGLRLLRPFRPYRQGRWLYDLPWTDPADEADPPGGAFDHAVVPGLPPRPRQIHSTARSGIRHRMDCSGRRVKNPDASSWPPTIFETNHLTDCSICHR